MARTVRHVGPHPGVIAAQYVTGIGMLWWCDYNLRKFLAAMVARVRTVAFRSYGANATKGSETDGGH